MKTLLKTLLASGMTTLLAALTSFLAVRFAGNLQIQIDGNNLDEILTVVLVLFVIVFAGFFAFAVYDILQKKREKVLPTEIRKKHIHLLTSIRSDVDKMIGKPDDSKSQS